MPDKSSPHSARAVPTPRDVAKARREFLAWIDAAGNHGRKFLQVHVYLESPGLYGVCHAVDAAVTAEVLEVHRDPYAAAHLAQTTSTGAHRPLKTAPNLRSGWRLVGLDAGALCTAMDYLYPACIAHWHAGRSGSLRVTHWKETAGRQSGIYSAVGMLAEPAVRHAARACCDDSVCLRRVAWQLDDDFALGAFPVEPPDAAEVPCPEACSLFIAFARKVLHLERQPRHEVSGLGALSSEELGQLREVTVAAAEGTLDAVREGDFEHGANRRRIRYLAARLQSEGATTTGSVALPHGAAPARSGGRNDGTRR